jgi:hypothetical protein
METTKWNCTPRRARMLTGALLCAFALSASVYAPASTAEQPQGQSEVLRTTIASMQVNDLEKAFWICDYGATYRGIDSMPVELCSAVYDALRERKFGGDFDGLLSWWRENKLMQHSAIAPR